MSGAILLQHLGALMKWKGKILVSKYGCNATCFFTLLGLKYDCHYDDNIMLDRFLQINQIPKFKGKYSGSLVPVLSQGD
jgi:hypothetical protein